MTRESEANERRSLWIPWCLAGIFGVFLLANGTMVYFAGRSWTGLTTDNAYERGLAYNGTLADAASQEALGWQVAIDARAADAHTAHVEVVVSDREGHPVAAATVSARLVRPTHTGFDREAYLRGLGAGRYVGDLDLALPGQWEVRVLIDHPGGTYRASRRVMLVPDG